MAGLQLVTAWNVYAAGSLEGVSCSGSYQRLFCDGGSWLGKLFQPESPWLGYILLECLFGTFLLFGAAKAFIRSRAQ